MTMAAAEMVFTALVIRRIEKMCQRCFKNIRHFEFIRLQIKRRLHPAHHRHDAETRGNFITGQTPEQRNALACKTDLLLGFTQGRGFAVRILRLNPPAGKTDLPRVVAQMRGALGQQHLHPAVAVDQRHQHRGFRDLGALAQRNHVQVVLFMRRRRTCQPAPNVFQRQYCCSIGFGARHGEGL